jgi:hypothetical protein
MIASAVKNIGKYALPGQPPTRADVRLVERPPEVTADDDETADQPSAMDENHESDESSSEAEPDAPTNLIVREANVYDGILESDVDRIVLDLPEPWQVLPHALDSLRSGGIIACYSPSIVQVQRTVEALEETRSFTQIESLEVLYRPWQIKGQAVRPVQQMVSHTAFLTFARRLAVHGRRPGDEPPPTDLTADAVADEDADLSLEDDQAEPELL